MLQFYDQKEHQGHLSFSVVVPWGHWVCSVTIASSTPSPPAPPLWGELPLENLTRKTRIFCHWVNHIFSPISGVIQMKVLWGCYCPVSHAESVMNSENLGFIWTDIKSIWDISLLIDMIYPIVPYICMHLIIPYVCIEYTIYMQALYHIYGTLIKTLISF